MRSKTRSAKPGRPPIAAAPSPSSSIFLIPLYLLLLIFLHVAFAFSRLINVIRSQLAFLRQTKATTTLEEDRLLEADTSGARWKKTPKHLAVVFVPSNTSVGWLSRKGEQQELEKLVKDLKRLVSWCEKLGITNLSVYDEKGVLDRNSTTVQEELALLAPILLPTKSQLLSPVPGCTSFRLSSPHASTSGEIENAREIDSGCGISESGAETPADSNSSPTLVSLPPISPQSSLKISLLSRLAGRPYLARVARDLAAQQDKDSKVAEGVVEEVLEASILSEPDLLLVLGGPYLRLRGYPPWHIRLTEMHHHSSPTWLPPPKLTYGILRKALDVYGGAEMRLGR